MERSKSTFKGFQKGDKVWLEATNLKMVQENRKFVPRRVGPFSILDVLGPLTYRLQLPATWKIHNVFHATLLTPYQETEAHGPNYLEPPPDLIEGEEEYEVEAILAHRRRRAGTQFLVKWVGYPDSENSWEPEKNLQHSPTLLRAYKQRHKL